MFWPQKGNAPCAATRPDVDDGYVCTTALANSICSGSTDTTPPAVAVTSPGADAVVSGAVTVSAAASDSGTGVAGVQFRLDGGALGSEDTTAPYTAGWDTRSVGNGPHVVTAVARDVAGNTATSTPVPLTVDNTTTTPTPPALLPLSVTLNQPTFTVRDLLVATVHAVSGPVTTPVDAYVVVQVPGGFLSLQMDGRLVPGLVPIARTVVLPTLSVPFSFPLAGAPPGVYAWLAGVTAPNTLSLAAPNRQHAVHDHALAVATAPRCYAPTFATGSWRP